MQQIRRGTTPTIHFTTTLQQSSVDTIYITFEQGGQTKVEKTGADVEWDSTGLSVSLSQEDTLSFSAGLLNVQIRARLNTLATATQILSLMVEPVLKSGVI